MRTNKSKEIDNLAAELKEYLNKHRHDKNFWDSRIGIIIQNFCKARGNFKSSPRGNPRKGYEKMLENKYDENN